MFFTAYVMLYYVPDVFSHWHYPTLDPAGGWPSETEIKLPNHRAKKVPNFNCAIGLETVGGKLFKPYRQSISVNVDFIQSFIQSVSSVDVRQQVNVY